MLRLVLGHKEKVLFVALGKNGNVGAVEPREHDVPVAMLLVLDTRGSKNIGRVCMLFCYVF